MVQETKTCCEEARLGKELTGRDHDQEHIDLGRSMSPDKCLMPLQQQSKTGLSATHLR